MTGEGGKLEGNASRSEDTEFRIDDRRHSRGAEPSAGEESSEAAPARPTVLEEYRLRAEAAERKLAEYADAFRKHREENDRVRERLARDVERKVELQFGALAADLLQTVDDLDLSLRHVGSAPESLVQGLTLARERFLAALERHGVERVVPDGEPFDPNVSEALRVDPVDTAELDGTVTETLQPGYRLGQRMIRAARVAVGRHTPS